MYSDRTNETILDRREMLRVKVKSLAEEARIIRREERRSQGVLREELYLHRVNPLRNAARHASIAYGLTMGHTLQQMEPFSYVPLNWPAIMKMMQNYGPKNFKEIVEAAKASEKVATRRVKALKVVNDEAPRVGQPA